MSATPPFTLTTNTLNVLIDNRFRSLPSTHPGFTPASALLRSGIKNVADLDALRELLDIPLFIAKITHGLLQCSDTAVLWDGQPLHTYATGKLLSMLGTGDDVLPLVRFIEKSMQNPVAAARDELYQWMEVGGMPLMPDGRFAAFKRVNDDYSSTRTGPNGEVIMNRVGDKPSMPRDEVDPDRRNTCSRGLHFCSYGYLPHFGGKRVMILAVDPADVVAIPEDYGITKGRAWTYEVVGEVPEEDCAHLFKGVHVTYTYADDGEEDVFDWDSELEEEAEDELDSNQERCDECGEDVDDCTCGECGQYADECVCDESGEPVTFVVTDENGDEVTVTTRDATPEEVEAFMKALTESNPILDDLTYVSADSPPHSDDDTILAFITNKGKVFTLDELLTDVEVFGVADALVANDLTRAPVNMCAVKKPKGSK